METILTQEWFNLYAIPVLICLARITDVTIGTLRIIFVSRGYKNIAPFLGFIEITIWILAIGQVMKNLDNFINIIAYATGFSLGNYIGIIIENRLAIGMVVIRIITKRDSTNLVNALREKSYNITVTDAEGNLGAVSIIFMNLKRSSIKDVVPIISKYNPMATYSIEDARAVKDPSLSFEDSPGHRHKIKKIFLRLKK